MMKWTENVALKGRKNAYKTENEDLKLNYLWSSRFRRKSDINVYGDYFI
jgi:hypothetical protein